MTSINEKMGLRRAGTRRMMRRLPKNLTERAELTSTRCPKCDRTGVSEYTTGGGIISRFCTWCHYKWRKDGGL